MREPLTEHERLVLRLVDAGYVRWRIAELTDRSEDSTRHTIRRLCERYDCRMEQLPDAAEGDLTAERTV